MILIEFDLDLNIGIIFFTGKPTLMEDASLWHLALNSASSKGNDPDDPDGEVPS